jgi:mannose/cellobiose epimerase-like protein (N-acyl-D-glucosamine 2-epimerase family)
MPDFRDRRVLLGHVRQTMDFYHPRCIDPSGGFYHYFKDDGTVYDRHARHLVSSTRFIFNYAMAFRHFGRPEHLEAFELAEAHFWEPQHGLYADEASADWAVLAPYRGQNANMHMCEALIAAFEASGEDRNLRRAETLARHVTVRQAALAGGLVWEHYRPDWSVDWDYNKNDKSNIFRPWRYQPGHLTEWAKLLLILERHAEHLANDAAWLAPRAQALFDAAVSHAWDHGRRSAPQRGRGRAVRRLRRLGGPPRVVHARASRNHRRDHALQRPVEPGCAQTRPCRRR